MSKRNREGSLIFIYSQNPYVGWDPILGMRVNVVCEAPPPVWESKNKRRDIPKQKRVQHYNRVKRMMFTRSIGYA